MKDKIQIFIGHFIGDFIAYAILISLIGLSVAGIIFVIKLIIRLLK